METKSSLQFAKDPATGPHPKPYEYTSLLHTLLL
jgi:hypothetical protein